MQIFKILKNMWELNSRCLNKIVAQMIERSLNMREVQGSIPCIWKFWPGV